MNNKEITDKIVLISMVNGVRISYIVINNQQYIQVQGRVDGVEAEIILDLNTLEVISTNNGFGFISDEDYINFVKQNKGLIEQLIRYNKSKHNKNKQSSKKYITYAVNMYNRIVHIDEVRSGIKCGCTCIACGDRLTARHGDKSIHRFNHTSKSDGECQDGYRQSIVLKLKRILEQQKKLKWPDEIYDMTKLRPEYTSSISIDGPTYDIISIELNEYITTISSEIRVDLMVNTANGKKIAIQVYEEESQKLREIGIPALNIHIDKVINGNIDFELISSQLTNDLIFKLETLACRREKRGNTLIQPCPKMIEAGDTDDSKCNECRYKCYMDTANIICSISSGMPLEQIIQMPISKVIEVRNKINSGYCPECGDTLDVKKSTRFGREFIGHSYKWSHLECNWLAELPYMAVSLKRKHELEGMLKNKCKHN